MLSDLCKHTPAFVLLDVVLNRLSSSHVGTITAFHLVPQSSSYASTQQSTSTFFMSWDATASFTHLQSQLMINRISWKIPYSHVQSLISCCELFLEISFQMNIISRAKPDNILHASWILPRGSSFSSRSLSQSRPAHAHSLQILFLESLFKYLLFWINWPCMHGFISGALYSVLFTNVFLFMPVPYCFNYIAIDL